MSKIVFAGDSITAWQSPGLTAENLYPHLVGTQLGYDTIINAGRNGDYSGPYSLNLDNLLDRFASDVVAHAPDIATIMIGSNDMSGATGNGAGPPNELGAMSQDAFIPLYLGNIEAMIDQCNAAGIKCIVASAPMSLTAYDTARWPRVINELRRLCVEKNVQFVDVFGSMVHDVGTMTRATFNQWFIDNYHPSATGHQRLADAFVRNMSSAAAVPFVPADGVVFDSSLPGTNLIFSNGDRDIKQMGSSTAGGSARVTESKTTGKWYFEVQYVNRASLSDAKIGVDAEPVFAPIIRYPDTTDRQFWYRDDGRANTGVYPDEATGLTQWNSTGSVVGCALDLDNMTAAFVGPTGQVEHTFTGIPAGAYYPFAGIGSGANNNNVLRINCGQDAFAHPLLVGFEPFNGT
jgi:lysophospholipase L1-like esterase